LGNVTPTLNITWDKSLVKKDGNEMRTQLRQGKPSIEVVGGKDNLSVTAWSLQEGEDKIVALKLKELLEWASA
jgi:L-seryl-tRNA(Ser) seleniumtransferase